MRRQRQKAERRRAATAPSVREIDIPLPLKGIMVQAGTARVSGLYAAELRNLRSTGVSLATVPGILWTGAPSETIQRIPYDFGPGQKLIEITPAGASCDTASIARQFGAGAMAAAISGSLLLFDGLGDPVRFDGTTFSVPEFVTDTDLDPAELDGAVCHHDRIIAWNSEGPPDFYYSAEVGAVMGDLVRFPLSRLGNVTGRIVAMQSLTIDAGHGMNDLLAIFTSTGQIIVYEGINPGDENDWRLTGRVQAAAPIGKLAFAQVGSDVWMLTDNGVVSVGESLRSNVLAMVSDLSLPVSELLVAWVKEGAADWTMFAAQDGSFIAINRVAPAGTARQLVFWLQSRSWATTDWPVRGFHALGRQACVTGFDGRAGVLDTTPGPEVVASWISSWFGAGGATAVRYIVPTIRALGPAEVTIAVLSDHRDTPADIAEATQTVTMTPETPGGRATLRDLFAIDAEGSEFQIRLEVRAPWAEIIGLTAALG